MRITFFEIEDWEKQYFQSALIESSLSFYETPLTKEYIASIDDTEVLSTFIYSKLSSEILLQLPKLKLITTRSTGFDHKEFLKTGDLKTQLLNHVLLTKENVIITPHNAFNSHEALQEILQTTVGNITSFLAGKPVNLVTQSK